MRWEHEEIRVIRDPETGLRAVIAIHSTRLGAALGGLRWWPYPHRDAAIEDALRLSQAMTFKAAAAGLDLGGGKSVIVADDATDRRKARLRRFAAELEDLRGRYITAEDIGTRTEDMDLLAETTRWAVGRSREHGGGGDPSPSTARTVFGAIEHACRVRLGRESVDAVRVGVIGLGKVGFPLSKALVEAGAEVIAADLHDGQLDRAAKAFGVARATAGELLVADLDVLAPCAVGGVVDSGVARSMRAKILAGAANNVLTSPAVADLLAERDILYVPDYLANCGGLIHCSDELDGFDSKRVARRVEESIGRTGDVLDEAARRGVTPASVAEKRVARRLGQHRTDSAA